MKIRVKEGLDRWLGGLGSLFGGKAREISGREMGEPRDDAEQALWQAMGWSEPEGEDALSETRRAVGEVLS